MSTLGTAPNRVVRDANSRRLAILAGVGFGFYLLLARLTFGNRIEQVALCALMFFMTLWSDGTRRFFVGVLPLVLYGMIYDCLRLLKPLLPSLYVHVAGPYFIERALFGFSLNGVRMTLNEFFAVHHWAAADFVAGIAYMAYLYVALGFALFLALRSPASQPLLLRRYAWAFFFVNVAGFATYYILPAAPPWYVATHGLGPADLSVAPSPAALTRWDAMTGIHYFAGFYGRSSDVFGSIPSLHCASPLVVLLYARELKHRWLSVALAFFYAVVCASAVYLQHHYVLDVCLGSLYALAGWRGELAWRQRRRDGDFAGADGRSASADFVP